MLEELSYMKDNNVDAAMKRHIRWQRFLGLHPRDKMYSEGEYYWDISR